jgi:putative transposase
MRLSSLRSDRNAKFASFDQVVTAQNIEVTRAPNIYAERWIRFIRQECLDHLVIVSERHLHSGFKENMSYYNHLCPHQGIDQHIQIGGEQPQALDGERTIVSRLILASLHHQYYLKVVRLARWTEYRLRQ